MPAEGCYTRRCFHKVTKNPAQILTAREKILMLYAGEVVVKSRLECPASPGAKKIAWRNVKNSAPFSGNPGKSEENRYLDRSHLTSWRFWGIDKMDFILFLCVEISSKARLQGSQPTYYITNFPPELQV